jgi:hypothetical protein
MQVQVVDKNGQIRPVVVWRCGPDIMFSETMDGMFDNDRRFRAPKWLVEQLDKLPPSKRFDSLGRPKINGLGAHSGADVESPDVIIEKPLSVVPDGMEDDDVPGVQQA